MTKSEKRWYDQNKALATSIGMLESLPEDMQTLVAESMITVAERECKADKLMTELKSLGAEVVLGLYKSKNKRRAYDNNPNMHKAMNYLYILPDESRTYMGEQITGVIRHVAEYLQTCKAASVEADLKDVASITKTYAEGGPEQAAGVVQEIRARYSVSADGVRERGEGMQVRE